GALTAGRQGRPADAHGGRRGGVRSGLRGRLRGGSVRRPRVGRGRAWAARAALRDLIYDPDGLPAEWPDVAAVRVNRGREADGKRTPLNPPTQPPRPRLSSAPGPSGRAEGRANAGRSRERLRSPRAFPASA